MRLSLSWVKALGTSLLHVLREVRRHLGKDLLSIDSTYLLRSPVLLLADGLDPNLMDLEGLDALTEIRHLVISLIGL